MRGAIPPLPNTSSWRGAQLITGTTLPSPLLRNYSVIQYRGRVATSHPHSVFVLANVKFLLWLYTFKQLFFGRIKCFSCRLILNIFSVFLKMEDQVAKCQILHRQRTHIVFRVFCFKFPVW
jgi:hypothetical protein